MMSRPLIFFAMLAAAVLASVAWAYPQYQEYAAGSDELQAKRQELASLDRYASRLQSISSQLGSYEPELNKVQAAVPGDVSLPALYNTVRQLAAESGTKLLAISSAVGGKEEGGARKSVRLGVTVQGSYEDLKAFLQNVQSSSRFFEVELVQFVGGEDEGQFQFQLQLTTYFF